MKKAVDSPVTAPSETTGPANVDRSREVIETMAREPGDHMTCVRVFDDFYRCNWWAPGPVAVRGDRTFIGLEVSTYRVRKSHFVKAAMRDGRLVVEDASPVKKAD